MQHPPPAPSSFDEIFEEPAGSPLNIGLLEYGLPNGSRGLVLQKIMPPAQAMHPRLEIGLAVSAVNGEPVTGGMEQVHAYLQVRPLTITFVRSPGTGITAPSAQQLAFLPQPSAHAQPPSAALHGHGSAPAPAGQAVERTPGERSPESPPLVLHAATADTHAARRMEVTQWLNAEEQELQDAFPKRFAKGTEVEIFSRSQHCWVAAQVVEEQGQDRILVSGRLNDGQRLQKSVNKGDPTAVRLRFPLAQHILAKDQRIAELTATVAQLEEEKDRRCVRNQSATIKGLMADVAQLNRQLSAETARAQQYLASVDTMKALIEQGWQENTEQKAAIAKVLAVANKLSIQSLPRLLAYFHECSVARRKTQGSAPSAPKLTR